MKRTISKLLGIAALAIASSALFVAPALAAPLQTVTQGGITCGEYTRGVGFPDTYWDCVTPLTGASGANAAANSANGLPANVKTVLQGLNTKIFVFANTTDYAAFSGGTILTSWGASRSMTLNTTPSQVIQMAAIFQTAPVVGVSTLMTPYYESSIRHQLGRIYGANAPTGLKINDPFFQAALNDDAAYLGNKTLTSKPNYPTRVEVFGATVGNLPAYNNMSPWEVLNARYGTTADYIYGYQVGRQQATPTVPELNTLLQNHLRTTRNYVSQQTFGVNPQLYSVNGGVLCVKHNGYNNFPLVWWNCWRPYTPILNAESVNTAPHTLPAAWQTLLQNAGIEVLAMRDIIDFKNWDGRWPGFYTGILGYSTHTGIKRSAAFIDGFTSEAHTTTDNFSTYMNGTILHELGHQFDRVIWNDISFSNSAAVPGSQGFRNAITLDKTAFNTGTCLAKVDNDRTANGLPAVCGNFPVGTSNWDVMTQTLYQAKDTDPPAATQKIYVELWARAFARRAGGSQPAYTLAVQNRMSNQHAFMNDLWSTGAPHTP